MLVFVLLISFFLLLFIGVPISFALSISSFTAVMTTGAIPVINLVQKTFRAIDSFTLLAIPFFVFAGNVMARGGVSKRLTDMAATLVGRMPGGLAHVACLLYTSCLPASRHERLLQPCGCGWPGSRPEWKRRA